MSTNTDFDPVALAALIQQLSMSEPERARAQLVKPVPIREWANTYRTYLGRKSESECTVKSYGSTLDLFVTHVEAHGSLVTKAIIEAFLLSRAEFARGANGANTWNRHLSTIRSMFNYLVANQIETDCPAIYREQALAVERMTKPISEAHPLAPTDWMAIWNSDLTLDERFWLGFSYYAGLRRFEVASLTVGQIDITGPFEDRWLRRIRRKGKGDRRYGDVPYGLMACLMAKHFPNTVGRNVRLWMECVEQVVTTRGPEPHTLVCVRADDRDPTNTDRFKWVNDDWTALCRKYGVTTHYKLHDLRDSCSTNLGNIEGLSADLRMKWMAHRDKATNDLYTHFDDEAAKRLL